MKIENLKYSSQIIETHEDIYVVSIDNDNINLHKIVTVNELVGACFLTGILVLVSILLLSLINKWL